MILFPSLRTRYSQYVAVGNDNAEFPDSVKAVLDWWLPRARTVIGDSFRSAYVYGSIAMEDFQPGWSDIDVCIVRSGMETSAQHDGWRDLQRETEARYLSSRHEGWLSGQVVDVVHVRADQGSPAREAFSDAFDLLSLSTCALHLGGEPMEFLTPERSDIANRFGEFLRQANAVPVNASAIWYASMLQLLARAHVYWHDDELVSKTEALVRAVASSGPAAPAYALALKIRREGSRTAAIHEQAFRSAYDVAKQSELRGFHVS